jgi:leucyl aminopeptidase
VNHDDLPTLPESVSEPLPLHLVADADFPAWLATQSETTAAWLQRSGFRPEHGRWMLVPATEGKPSAVIVGTGKNKLDPHGLLWLAAAIAARLPAGDHALVKEHGDARDETFATGWAIGSYRYARYKSAASRATAARLRCPAGVNRQAIAAAVNSNCLARDLINTPANDMGPAELAAAAVALAERGGGSARVVLGDELVAQFPLVAAVGQGSARTRAPRLIDLKFPRPGAPKITLVGKGVCFDTGGLDLKPAAGMLLMKKDMGGAACALATAQLLLDRRAQIDLRVLIPAVENSVDGLSFRPGDVWRSRKGLTVEITNTDAEGRLVLADALTAAGEENPDLIIDFATLTGAARVALGAELPPIYGGNPELLQQLLQHGVEQADPVWQMPLWDGYEDDLDSRIADLNNAPPGGMAGSITAALFLRRFVADPVRWIHLDIYGWNAKDRPGRPLGAEAQGVRAVAAFLLHRYG